MGLFTVEVALYADIIREILGEQDSEGIPYMGICGVWGRIYVDDVSKFCRLYGYQHGRPVTSVHSYGGFIWESYPSLDCLSKTHMIGDCLNLSALSLRNEWYNGLYIQCSNAVDIFGNEGMGMERNKISCIFLLFFDLQFTVINLYTMSNYFVLIRVTRCFRF